MPASKDESVWGAAAVRCVSQAENSLNFTCSTVPTEDISVYVNITQTAYQLDVTWDTSKEYPFGDITPAEMRAKIGAATATDLTAHANNKSNPHGVTPAQIGAATTTELSNAVEWVTPKTRKINGLDLSADRTLTGENIAVSPTDPTSISGALKYRCNPNLLDNWYFANPVDQKNGYYIPKGVKYNTLSWTEAGTTDKAYPVIGYSGQDPLITVNGTNYIVGKSAQVPGYCTIGYTVDRWKLDVGEAVTLEDGCICLKKSGTYWGEYFDDFDQFIGMTLTGSVLLSDGTLRTGSFVYNGLLNQGQTFFSSELGFYIQRLSDSLTQCEINSLADNVKIKAAKLELGDTQTLAHKEGDKWVLNEIPDFGEQLRRCQRLAIDGKYYTTVGQLNYSGDTYYVSVQFPCVMRTSPVITLKEISAIGWGALPISSAEVFWNDANGFFVAIKDLTNMNNFIGKSCIVTYFASADL